MKFLSCILLHDGVLTREQLVTALEQQLLSGADLTNIYLELGYMTEEQILKYLEIRYRLSGKTRDDFENCQEALSKFPELLIWRHQVFPLCWQRTTLHLGMVQPNDRLAQLSIANHIHGMVRPYVISRSTWDYLIKRHLVKPDKDREVAALSLGPLAAVNPLEWVQTQLSQAQNAQTVTKVVLQYLSQCCRRGLLFLIRQGQIRPWTSFGFAVTDDEWRQFSYPADRGVMFELVHTTAPYIGKLNDDKYLPLRELLALPDGSRSCIICPLVMGQKVVQLFYLDNDGGRMEANKLGEITLVLHQAAKVYEELLRKTVEEHTKNNVSP